MILIQVVIFEHKGLYWSKVANTETAKCPLPDEAYIVPIGEGRNRVGSHGGRNGKWNCTL
jgi:hypothetical protein